MKTRLLFVLGTSMLAACGATSLGSSSDVSSGSSSSRSVNVTVQSNLPGAGSSVAASFTTSASVEVQSSCTTTTIGPCTYNPCSVPAAAALGTANVGAITISVAGSALSTLEPEDGGTYPSLSTSGAPAWGGGGEAVTVQWANAPGDPSLPGGSFTFATPPYVALSDGSAFATNPGTLARSSDLTLAWASDTPGTSADQLVVDVTTNPAQLLCEFSASAGSGTIPAAALALVSAGPATYDVHSKEFGDESLLDGDGNRWSAGVNIDAHARAKSGLAYGKITVQ